MRDLICKIFGHSWRYSFSSSDCFNEKIEIRDCRCCKKIQSWRKFPTIINPNSETWSTMISYTKKGAEKHMPSNKL